MGTGRGAPLLQLFKNNGTHSLSLSLSQSLSLSLPLSLSLSLSLPLSLPFPLVARVATPAPRERASARGQTCCCNYLLTSCQSIIWEVAVALFA